MDKQSIAQKLSDAFVNSRMTFDDLSMKTSIPKSALHRYMTGETPKIPLDRFEEICKALGLDAAETLGWTFAWDHTVHKMPAMKLPSEITLEKEEIEQAPAYSQSDKTKMYQALGALAKADPEAAANLFKALVDQGVL